VKYVSEASTHVKKQELEEQNRVLHSIS